MTKHNGFPAVQYLDQRSESRIAQIPALVAREDANAVGFERVQRVFDFTDSTINVRQRQYRKQTKPARIILHNLCSVLVAFARKRPSRGIVGEPHAGIAYRNNGSRNATLLLLFERYFWCSIILGVLVILHIRDQI